MGVRVYTHATMTEIQLSRRSILISIAVVALATAAAGAGTMALFQDHETSTNTIQMGTLNLSVNGQNEAVQQLDVGSVEPGQTNSSIVNITNDGTNDGYVDIEVTNLTNKENNCVEPEREVDNSCETNQGELSDNINVTIFFDIDNDGEIYPYASGNEIVAVRNATLSNISGKRFDTNYPLLRNESTTIRVRTSVPETAGNDIQTDSVEFNLSIHLDQKKDTE
ncbi:MAG: TasA family protein [Halorientalis sp.]